jgi:hypothetical protein
VPYQTGICALSWVSAQLRLKIGMWGCVGMYGRFGTTLSVKPGTPGSTIKGTFQRQITNIRDTIDSADPSVLPSSSH